MIEAVKLEADIYPAGPRGLSAYEIYKKEGGQLSEEEWLKSLNGLTPTIGENGNWFLGTVDTGLPSRGPKGDTGSIKFIVVTELPTENIDETAIYMKPVEKPTGENKFEELIYVNGKWEDLGTPNVAVDLSNYYTKEESDEKLLAKQDKLLAGDNIEISDDNVISVSGIEFPIYRIQTIENSIYTTGYTRINDQSKLKITEEINKAYKNGLNSIGFIVSSGTNNEQYLFVNNNVGIQTKPINYWLYSIDSIHNRYNNAQSYSLLTLQLTISLSWTGDTCSCTSALIWKVELPLLATNNLGKYTPTGDYNPSTKLYTDKTHYEKMTGYDATKTQVLKNINGTLTWVDEV
jgi:hypothetical protein